MSASFMLIVPDDVRSWLLRVFGACNTRASAKLSRIPTTWEPWLDMAVIEELSQHRAPVRFRSNWTVRLETHFLGSFPLQGNWEVADIGLLIIVRRGLKLVMTKVALLQSKRLYPDEQEYNESEEEEGFRVGFGRYFLQAETEAELSHKRQFGFTESSRYKALRVRDEQYGRIADYERRVGIPVHYLFYNPWRLPWQVVFPLEAATPPRGRREVGCRVVAGAALRSALSSRPANYVPSFSDFASRKTAKDGSIPSGGGWPLERFVVHQVLSCREGYVTAEHDDPSLSQAFFGRTAPISAAITISFDLPGD